MQEHNVVAALHRAHVQVLRPCVAGRELREFEVVRRKQREAAVLVVQLARDGAGQRQAVEGAGATVHFVHQHQALFGGAVHDGGGLGHLEHEGAFLIGQVVGGADAGVDGERP